MVSKRMTEAFRRIQEGEITIRELKGITNEEMAEGVQVSRRLIEDGRHQAAAEILAGLALYDPFRADVWQALEDLFRRQHQPWAANLFSGLAKVMAS